jgi:hypothetical protein
MRILPSVWHDRSARALRSRSTRGVAVSGVHRAADRGGGLRALALPKDLIDTLEAQLPETSCRDVTGYVTYLLRQVVEESYAYALTADEIGLVKARLRDLGYFE